MAFLALMWYILSHSWGIPLNNRRLNNLGRNVEYLSYEHTWQFFSTATDHTAHVFWKDILRYRAENQLVIESAERSLYLLAVHKLQFFAIVRIEF